MNKQRYFLDLGLGFAQFSAMANERNYEMTRDIALLLGLEFPDYNTLKAHRWWDFKPPQEWFEERDAESLRDFYQIGKLLYLRFLLALPSNPDPDTQTEQIDQSEQQLEDLFDIEDIPEEILKEYLSGLETGKDPNQMLREVVRTLRRFSRDRHTGSIGETIRSEKVPAKPLKVFISYARENHGAKRKLLISLVVMIRNGLIEVWQDDEVLPGDRWEAEIDNNLQTSELLLFLVSMDSLASEHCQKELRIALEQRIRVIPIILERCDWQQDQLGALQGLPDNGIPINEWQTEAMGLQNVVEGIRGVVEKMLM